MATLLDRLSANRQWVAWCYLRRGPGKPTKPPINPHTGRLALIDDNSTWGSWEEADRRRQLDGLPGVGYVFTLDDGLVGADLDNVKGEDGHWLPWVQEIIDFNETYIEVSPSGNGLRIIWLGLLPDNGKAIINHEKQVELYCKDRYLTLTRNQLPGTPDDACEAPRTLAALMARAATNGHGRAATATAVTGDAHTDLDTTALQNLSLWVPELFGARARPRGNGYRVSSLALGRDLVEDLAITPQGIKDFGVHDMGDSRGGRRTPTALVQEHKPFATTEEAITWLCEKLGCERPPELLSPGTPMKSARALMLAKFTDPNGKIILRRYAGTFWGWGHGFYRRYEDEDLQTLAARFLEHARKPIERGTAPFNPKYKDAVEVAKFLGVVGAVDPEKSVPCWIEPVADLPPVEEFIACANGLLHLQTMTLYPPTPNYFNFFASPVAYDPEAATPDRWLAFLDQTVDDAQGIQLIQEWMGYILTNDVSMQKILLCLGPSRSGKGTFARIMTALVGHEALASPTVAQLSENFGCESLITKAIATITDARLGSRTNQAALSERLLTLSGEDIVTIPRKFKPDWIGHVQARIIWISNEIPAIAEGSSALAKRFMGVLFKHSFYGREDTGLTKRLTEELPGILLWAVEGVKRLRARGHFVQPDNARGHLEEVEVLGSPVRGFLDDCCELGETFEVGVDLLFERYKDWCVGEGRRDPGTKTWFGRNLYSAVNPLSKARRGGQEILTYIGLRLRNADTHRVVDDDEIPF